MSHQISNYLNIFVEKGEKKIIKLSYFVFKGLNTFIKQSYKKSKKYVLLGFEGFEYLYRERN